jgi:hypothetical protein
MHQVGTKDNRHKRVNQKETDTQGATKTSVKAKGRLPDTGMNGLETRFAGILEARKASGEVLWYMFQPMGLNIGTGAKYRPDFGVLLSSGEFVFYETKGFWREASRVRIKVAAALFPFRFIAVKWSKKDGWDYEEF